MIDMKCPLCQQELQETYDGKQFWCSNYKDPTHPINLQGTKELWQELIRTRKALEIAVDALKKIGFGCGIPPDENYAYNYINIAADAYQQIQELEQKE